MSFPISPAARIPAKNLLYLGAALSLVTALAHIWVMQDHFEEWWGYGAFFLVVVIAQAIFGLVLLNWPSRKLVLIGIAGTLVLILLYIINHTVGVPYFGPHAGEPEKFKVVGLVSKAAELALVLTLVGLIQNRKAPQPLGAVVQQHQ